MLVLDGGRGLAALLVVLVHGGVTAQLVPQATLAVDYFFVLSGLVMAHAYGPRLADGSISLGRFFLTRFVRLYPMIALGMVMGAVAFLVRMSIWPIGIHLERVFATVGAGLLLVPLPPGFLVQWIDFIYPLDLPAWSLFYETISNIVYAPLARFLTLWHLLPAMTLFGLLYAGSLWIHRQSTVGVTLPYIRDGLLRVAYGFTAGLVIHRLLRPELSISVKWLPIAIAAFVLATMNPLPWAGGPSHLVYLSCALFLMPVLVFVTAHMHPGPRLAAACSFLGRLSYPLYLVHYPVIYLFEKVLRRVPMHGGVLLGFVGLQMASALGTGILAMRLFDEPVRAWLGRRLLQGSRPQRAASPAVGSEAG